MLGQGAVFPANGGAKSGRKSASAKSAAAAAAAGTAALAQAAARGDLATLHALLRSGVPAAPAAVGEICPAIVSAVKHGQLEALRALLEAGGGAPAAAGSPLGLQWLLNKAVRHGRLAVLEFLLECGAAPDAPDAAGNRPLFWCIAHAASSKAAADSDALRAARALLLRGADPNAVAGIPGVPLLHGLLGRPWKGSGAVRAALVDLLLKHGATANQPDFQGATALHYALDRAPMDSSIVRMLLGAGASPNLGCLGSLPLHWLLGHAHPGAAQQAAAEAAALLLQAGADPAVANINSMMPPHYALQLTGPGMDAAATNQVVALLLQKGAPPNAPLPDRRRPLHLAALLAAGADVALPDAAGRTPFAAANAAPGATPALRGALYEASAGRDLDRERRGLEAARAGLAEERRQLAVGATELLVGAACALRRAQAAAASAEAAADGAAARLAFLRGEVARRGGGRWRRGGGG
ncbi:MAG: ankyrin repeat-containing domain protein [Monoraphidium minutum]|nr:MAG: ankyrin repeat-containing domain protein [Monoraphidium minutum]